MSEYTPTMENIRDCYARYGNETTRTAEFDRAIAAHDRALREQIAREILDGGCRHPGYLAIPFAEFYARIARGEGSE